jgi:type VI secretion system protein ImpL
MYGSGAQRTTAHRPRRRAALIAALIWLFGPFLCCLESWITRAAGIAVTLLIWAVLNFWLDRRAARTSAR